MDVKIVKSFLDNQYSHRPEHCIEWHWGLGADGKLYYRSLYPDMKHGWHKCSEFLPRYFSLGDMKRVVAQFGDLLLWL